MVFVGPCASRSAHSRAAASSSAARHDLVHDADALGVGGREVVAEEHELLRLVEADQPGERYTTPAVGDEPAPHEHLDEAGGVGGDHQVGGQRHRDAAAGRGAVDARR